MGRSDNWFYTTCQVSSDERNNLSGEDLSRFNRYMTKVSSYMRKGENYTDMAVYIPMEDAWIGGPYSEEILSMMPWAGGQYEMRYIDTPEKYKGRQPYG